MSKAVKKSGHRTKREAQSSRIMDGFENNLPLKLASILTALALGFFAVQSLIAAPEPQAQIASKPVIDIIVAYEGGSSNQVEKSVTKPLEHLIGTLPSVKHVYALSRRGEGRVRVEFEAHERGDVSLAKIKAKLGLNPHTLPKGAGVPRIELLNRRARQKMRLILVSRNRDRPALRRAAQDLREQLESIEGVSKGRLLGGQSSPLRIEVIPERLHFYDLPASRIARIVRQSKLVSETGTDGFKRPKNMPFPIMSELKNLVVGLRKGKPVYLRDVARFTSRTGVASDIVRYYSGPSARHVGFAESGGTKAVAIQLSYETSKDSALIERRLVERLEVLKNTLLPRDINIMASRSYRGLTLQKEDLSEIRLAVNLPPHMNQDKSVKALDKMARSLVATYEVAAVQIFYKAHNSHGMIDHFFVPGSDFRPFQAELAIQFLNTKGGPQSRFAIRDKITQILTPIAAGLKADFGLMHAAGNERQFVAEISGERGRGQQQTVKDMTDLFQQAGKLVDIGNSMSAPRDSLIFEVDMAKAKSQGVEVGSINRELALLAGNYKLGQLNRGSGKSRKAILLEAPLKARLDMKRLLKVPVRAKNGQTVSLEKLGGFKKRPLDPVLHRKDGKPIVYIWGRQASTTIEQTNRFGAQLNAYQAAKGITVTGRIEGSEVAPISTQGGNMAWYLLAGLFAALFIGAIKVHAVVVDWLQRERKEWREIDWQDLDWRAHKFEVPPKLVAAGVAVNRWAISTMKKTIRGVRQIYFFLFTVAYDLIRRWRERPLNRPVNVQQTSGQVDVSVQIMDEDPLLADDLKRIKGIGPMIEELLNERGINSYEQIATLRAQEIRQIETELSKNNQGAIGRITRDGWQKQAKRLARGETPAATAPQPSRNIGFQRLHNKANKGVLAMAQDDLRQIKGIGRVIEKILVDQGITKFDQIARLSSYELEQIGRELDKKPRLGRDRITRDNWVGQAQKMIAPEMHALH